MTVILSSTSWFFVMIPPILLTALCLKADYPLTSIKMVGTLQASPMRPAIERIPDVSLQSGTYQNGGMRETSSYDGPGRSARLRKATLYRRSNSCSTSKTLDAGTCANSIRVNSRTRRAWPSKAMSAMASRPRWRWARALTRRLPAPGCGRQLRWFETSAASSRR